MRVRVVKKTQSYWNYAIQTFEPDEELDGELARHLADNAPAGTVEVIDEDREEARAAAERAAEMAAKRPPEDPEPDARTPAGQGDGDGTGDGSGSGQGDGTQAAPDGDGPPVDGTIEVLMVWIGDDKDRAAQALEAEQAKDHPRITVVKRLGAIVGDDE